MNNNETTVEEIVSVLELLKLIHQDEPDIHTVISELISCYLQAAFINMFEGGKGLDETISTKEIDTWFKEHQG